ncbi:MAG: TSUP family transporter [Alphaproteobacteria bacterium]
MNLIAIPIICFSFFTQAAFGFGGGLIAISLLSLFLDAKDAVVMVMFFQFLIGLLIFKLWKEVDKPTLIRLAPGLAIGTLAGFFMFSYVNTRIVDAALAVYILIFLAQERGWMNWLSHAGKAVPEHVIPHITSVIGGFIQGTTGTGGPTVIPYIKTNTSSALCFRATMICLFFSLNGLRLMLTGVPHFADPQLLHTMLLTIPFFVLSIYLGYKAAHRIPMKVFQFTITALLLGSACSLAIKSFTMS